MDKDGVMSEQVVVVEVPGADPDPGDLALVERIDALERALQSLAESDD